MGVLRRCEFIGERRFECGHHVMIDVERWMYRCRCGLGRCGELWCWGGGVADAGRWGGE